MASTIPVIDFSLWIKGGEQEKRCVARDLADACRRVGFVYVVNHLVQDHLLDEAFQWSRKLFALPQDKKMLAPHPPGTLAHLGLQGTMLAWLTRYNRAEHTQRLLMAWPGEGVAVFTY